MFLNQRKEMLLSSGPDLDFKGVSCGLHRAGLLTSGPFLLVSLPFPGNGVAVGT